MKSLIQFFKTYPIALILLVGFMVHIPYLTGGFVWVDHNDIERRQAVVPFPEISTIFTKPFGDTSFYRPIVVLVNSLDFAYHGNFAFGFHLTNLLLHLCAVFLLGYFLTVFFDLKKREILLSQLIFAVHPMAILIVGAITRRQETLLAIFYFLTLIYYNKARLSHRLKDVIATACFFFLSLLTKETAIGIIPLTILLWEYIHLKKNRTLFSIHYISGKIKKNLPLLFSLLSIVFVYLGIRFQILGLTWNTKPYNLSIQQLIVLRVSLFYKWIQFAFSPLKPSLSDAVSISQEISVKSIILVFGTFLFLYFFIKNAFNTTFFYFFLLLIITILPGLYFIPVPRIGTPNYGYLPASIGSAIFVWVLFLFEKKYKKYVFLISFCWITIAAISTYQSGSHFESDLTLFLPEVQKDVHFREGYYFLGNYYLERNDLENASIYFEKAIEPFDTVLAFGNRSAYMIYLAGIRIDQQKWDEANDLYDKAGNNADPNLLPVILFNKALIADHKNNSEDVISLLTQRDDWQRPEPYYLLAKAYSEKGETQKSEEMIQKAEKYQTSSESSYKDNSDIPNTNP